MVSTKIQSSTTVFNMANNKKSVFSTQLSSEFLCLWSFSLFMAPRDSGIGTELDLELDEGSYEEEEEGNMDEERWGTMQTTPLIFITFLGSTASWTPTAVALSSFRFDRQMTANKSCGSSVFASGGPTAKSNIAV